MMVGGKRSRLPKPPIFEGDHVGTKIQEASLIGEHQRILRTRLSERHWIAVDQIHPIVPGAMLEEFGGVQWSSFEDQESRAVPSDCQRPTHPSTCKKTRKCSAG